MDHIYVCNDFIVTCQPRFKIPRFSRKLVERLVELDCIFTSRLRHPSASVEKCQIIKNINKCIEFLVNLYSVLCMGYFKIIMLLFIEVY